MLKAISGRTAHEMIDAVTKENGGVPVILYGSNQPLTKEYWDETQKKLRAKIKAHTAVKNMGKLTSLTFL